MTLVRCSCRWAALLVVTLVGSTLMVTGEASSAVEPRERFIVVLKDDVPNPRTVAREQERTVNGRVRAVYDRALKGYSLEATRSASAMLRRDPRVAYVESDQPVAAFGGRTGVDRIEADKVVPPGSTFSGRGGVDIAIIDSGIAPHPDLNIVDGANCTTFSASGPCVSGGFGDGNGHGTHVAGIAAARGQAPGVAPGARLFAVKALNDNGAGSMSGIIAAIDWVTARASTIEVANLSFGCECVSQALEDAVSRSTDVGLVYVAAAGNGAKDASAFSPANLTRVIAVSSMADFDGRAGGGAGATCRSDDDDSLSDFSNFGAVVDLAAPGTCITSTAPNGGYTVMSGTSMASPHVAGAAALYVARNFLPAGPERWSQVLSGLRQSWSVPQSDRCGFTGGRSGEPLLLLAPCDTTQGTSTGTTSTTVPPNTTVPPTTTVTVAPTTTTTVGTTSTTRAPTTSTTSPRTRPPRQGR